MKKKILRFLFFLLLLASGQAFAEGQTKKPGEFVEKVVLFTDRSIYIVGEQVHFFTTLFTDDSSEFEQSQILYCELITHEGNKISGNKYLISQLSAEGCIAIPADLLTGTYYLRAYTRVMRNYGPESYEYQQIRIINTGRGEVLAGDDHEKTDREHTKHTYADEKNNLLSVSIEKSAYTPRDTINFSVQAISSSVTGIKSLCLSVVPEGTKSSLLFSPTLKRPTETETGHYPETRGLSLTGKLTEVSSQIPVQDKKVNLSIIGEGRDFMAVSTDSSGCFFFALPGYYGSRDLFLCAERTPSTDLKIWVDNDFCTLPVSLPVPVFSLTGEERQIVQNMALNVQIDSHFHDEALKTVQDVKEAEVAFYGNPSSVLYLDQYILLPTLEEYFNELPSPVKVRKHLGGKYFKITGPRDLSFFDPLVLIDWVAVDEPSKILAVSPQNVSRIEVVNQTYVKGGQTYGGIISIVSKKGDFAGIDLPSTGIFINYRFLTENQCREKNDYNIPNHPDARNTLLWETRVSLQEGKSKKFFCTAPDTPGKYAVVLEGINFNGERFSQSSVFEVKN